jgi:MFS family permease
VAHWGVSTWVPQYADHVATRAGYTAGRWGALAGVLYSVGSIAGYLVLGMLGDLCGRKPTIGLFFAGSVVVAVAPFLIENDLVLFMAAATINGFFTLGQFAWMTMYLPEVYPTAVRGTGTAVVFNSARYIAAFGPLVAGWVVESLGGLAHAARVDERHLPSRPGRHAVRRSGDQRPTTSTLVIEERVRPMRSLLLTFEF